MSLVSQGDMPLLFQQNTLRHYKPERVRLLIIGELPRYTRINLGVSPASFWA